MFVNQEPVKLWFIQFPILFLLSSFYQKLFTTPHFLSEDNLFPRIFLVIEIYIFAVSELYFSSRLDETDTLHWELCLTFLHFSNDQIIKLFVL